MRSLPLLLLATLLTVLESSPANNFIGDISAHVRSQPNLLGLLLRRLTPPPVITPVPKIVRPPPSLTLTPLQTLGKSLDGELERVFEWGITELFSPTSPPPSDEGELRPRSNAHVPSSYNWPSRFGEVFSSEVSNEIRDHFSGADCNNTNPPPLAPTGPPFLLDETYSPATPSDTSWLETSPAELIRSKFNLPPANAPLSPHHFLTEVYTRYFRSGDGPITPAIKCYSLIPVKYEDMQRYMSNSSNIKKYNSFITHKLLHTPTIGTPCGGGVMEVPPPPTPSLAFSQSGYSWFKYPTKLCYAESPKVLFIPPRPFLTLMQLKTFTATTPQGAANTGMVVTHVGVPRVDSFGDVLELPAVLEGRTMANSIRGLTLLMPWGPNHTAMALLAHADPGRGIPEWGVKAAVSTLSSCEPFRYFWRLGMNAKEFASGGVMVGGEGRARIGLSQLGYAGFWDRQKEATD